MLPIQSFKLSPQGRIASAVSIALVLPFTAAPAVAANITPVGDTTVSQVGKVDVVNIAKPNNNGLSHNQYKDYNVGKSGAVLNNALKAGQSQLAGQLAANQNLNDKAASVILNEVVTQNPSLLLGQQEVFGMAADYVLANPNGITCEGCGFINTNRASLVVGTPTINNERLDGFKVGDKQSNTLSVQGKVNGEKRLDLLAPKVDINGNLTASDAINVIAGRNQIGYDNLQTTALEGKQPHVTLDGQVLGSMQSGRIRLHNTDQAATQTLQGQFNATDSFDASANTLKVMDSEIAGDKVSLAGEQALYVGGTIQRQREALPKKQQKLDKGVTLTNTGYQEKETYQGSKVNGDSVALTGGNVLVEGSQVQANNISAKGDNVRIGGVMTTDTTSETARKSKGLWFNEVETLNKTQQYHQSSLTAKEGLSVQSDADLSVAGASLKGNRVDLSSGEDLVVAAEIGENSLSNINRYKNETAALKAGERNKTNATQHAYQTSISGDQVALNSGADQVIEGAEVTAQSAKFNSGKDLTLSSSATTNRQSDEESFKYWGGIGGGETHIDNHAQTNRVATQVNAGNVTLSSAADTKVAGSQVAATQNANINAGGTATISHDFDSEHDYQEARHGTVFNITDVKQVRDHLANTSNSANVSAQNLAISGDKVVITGSNLTAKDGLNVTAQTALNTNIANATDLTETEHYDVQSDSNVEWKGGLAGEAIASASVKGVTTNTRTGTGSATKNTLTGRSVTLNGADVALKGSNIKATQDATVTGDTISIGAGEALVAENSKVTKRTGPDVYIKGGMSGITVGASIGTDQEIDQYHEYQALTSDIAAGNQVALTATEALSNQGTRATAKNIRLNAKDISNQAAHDRVVDRHVEAGGKAAIEAYAKTSPLVGGNISLSAQGTGTTTEDTKAHVTQLTATDGISASASNKAVDEGTQMTAKTIKLAADDYQGSSAYDATVTTVHAGKGSVAIDANTSNFNDININVGGKGQYQYLQEGDAKAVKGSLKADQVTIGGGARAVAAQDVEANDYLITAIDEARIGQNNDKQWKTLGGAKLGGSIGATIIPAAQAGTPSFSVDAGFNYLQVDDSQAQAANVKAQQVSVNADKLAQIDGAHITANSVDIKGQQANIAAAQDRHHAVGVSMDGNAALSLSIAESGVTGGSAGLGGNLGVVNETANQAHGADITTKTLNVTANDSENALTVEGANITADKVNLSNSGDVNVVAAASKSNIGNFGIGGNLSAGASSEAFKKANVAGHLEVKTDNSEYYTLGNMKAGQVAINAGNDVNLQSNVDAGSLNVKAGQDFNIKSAQDVVRKVDFESALNIGGSPVIFNEDTTAEDVLNAFRDDFNNGTVLGVKASGKLGLLVDHQQQTHQASVQADSLDANVGSGEIAVNAAKVAATNANTHDANISTSNNDDFVHTIGGRISVKTPNLSQIIDDAIAGNEVESPIEVGGTFEWDDEDRDNTKADVSL